MFFIFYNYLKAFSNAICCKIVLIFPGVRLLSFSTISEGWVAFVYAITNFIANQSLINLNSILLLVLRYDNIKVVIQK